jgi:hypothetical protein
MLPEEAQRTFSVCKRVMVMRVMIYLAQGAGKALAKEVTMNIFKLIPP